jgi:hypothetical protein
MSDEELYRVYIKQEGQETPGKPLYLPSGPGMPLEEAQRQHELSAADTFIHCVYRPENDDA